ncbi:hypothetical protein H0H92_001817 [Tricholoma furcatifolium]|nr:hypothetical protein H0H92_001817 [Tricholoma furcatifolium]
MTNPKETPEPPVPTPGSDLEAKDPTSPAFKDQLRAKFADYKKKLQDELATPPEVPPVSPPWTKDDKKVMGHHSPLESPELTSHLRLQQWTMAEKQEWWAKQPLPTPRKSSVGPEFRAWLKDVYPEDHDVFFNEREQEALAEAGF